MTPTPDALAAIEARAAAATPNAVSYSYEGTTRGEHPRHQFSVCNGTWGEDTRPHRCIAMFYSDSADEAPDAEFFANARGDVLALVAEVRRLRALFDAGNVYDFDDAAARLRNDVRGAAARGDLYTSSLAADVESILDGVEHQQAELGAARTAEELALTVMGQELAAHRADAIARGDAGPTGGA